MLLCCKSQVEYPLWSFIRKGKFRTVNTQRPTNFIDWNEDKKCLWKESSIGRILWFRQRKNFHLLDQLQQNFGIACGRTLQEPMAGGTLFQVAQAAPENQTLRGNNGERSEDPNLYVHNYELPCGDCSSWPEIKEVTLWNTSNSRDVLDGQNTPLWTFSGQQGGETGKWRWNHTWFVWQSIFKLNF